MKHEHHVQWSVQNHLYAFRNISTFVLDSLSGSVVSWWGVSGTVMWRVYLYAEMTLTLPYILECNPHPFYSVRGQKSQMQIIIACGLDSRSKAGFWKNDRAVIRAIRTIQYNNLSWKNVKTASSVLGNHPFLGPVNFLRDASRPLFAVLWFCRSRTALSSTPTTAAALRFPFSSAHRITSRLNFAVYDSL